MDSVTQIALGSAVSEAVMQNKVGRKATLWGAIIGTLPDLDVLIPMGDAVKDFTYHRAASHSFFFMLLVVPIILWIILAIHPKTKIYWKNWVVQIVLTLFTHSLLDSFNIYGTQLFLPFSNYPVGFGSMFVIDPFYTIPLLIGVFSFFILKFKPNLAGKINYLGIVFSSLYLLWSIIIQHHVIETAKESLTDQNIKVSKIMSTPTPFNTILWRIIGITETGYVEGFYSLLDDDSEVSFTIYSSENSKLDSLNDSWTIDRLQWFTKGFYKTEFKDSSIVLTDLRMGFDPIYFFSFIVGKYEGSKFIEIPSIKLNPENYDMPANLKILWNKVWNDDANY